MRRKEVYVPFLFALMAVFFGVCGKSTAFTTPAMLICAIIAVGWATWFWTLLFPFWVVDIQRLRFSNNLHGYYIERTYPNDGKPYVVIKRRNGGWRYKIFFKSLKTAESLNPDKPKVKNLEVGGVFTLQPDCDEMLSNRWGWASDYKVVFNDYCPPFGTHNNSIDYDWWCDI